ncbi:response regulator transcription factor [Erysipelotrichaceae bacterium RD49]|nr:response regulator transcription factor [Erysipelotrichaceae bacterium RD49]
MDHTILVAEDDNGLREAISIYLKSQGYKTILAENGKEGLDALRKASDVHLAIVDLMMPVMDGLTMIQEIRKNNDFPIIILSARSEEVDKINGLTMGADDYLTKPFSSMELLARVNAALRRYERFLEMKSSSGPKKTEVLVNRGLELNSITKEVRVEGKPVHLTPKEFMILELLMRNPGRVFSAAEIYEAIWKEDAISTETITVHIRKLREKIEENPKKPVYLQVVWGLGYKLRKETD